MLPILLLLAALALVALWTARRMDYTRERVVLAFEEVLAMEQVRVALGDRFRALAELLLDPTSPEARRKVVERRAAARRALDRWGALVEAELAFVEEDQRQDEMAELEVYRQVASATARQREEDTRILELVDAGDTAAAGSRYLAAADGAIAIGRLLDLQIADEYGEIAAAEVDAVDVGRTSLAGVLVTGGLAVAAACAAVVALSRTLVKPVELLTEGVARIGAGDLSFRLHLRSQDEIATLAAGVTTMAEELGGHIETQRQLASAETRNAMLRRTIEDLSQVAARKDSLMRELNHRVRNNLAMVSSLVRLRASERESTDLDEVGSQIEAIRLVHEELSRSDAAGTVALQPYLTGLVEALVRGLTDLRIVLDLRIAEVHTDSRTAVTLGLIVNEIVTNSVKYGFAPTNAENRFFLQLEDTREGRTVAMTARNSGPPIPPTVNLESPTTLGMSLIRALADQLRGTIHFERGPAPTIDLRFPV